MTSSNGNIFRVTGILCGEFTGDRETDDLIRHRAHYDIDVMFVQVVWYLITFYIYTRTKCIFPGMHCHQVLYDMANWHNYMTTDAPYTSTNSATRGF